MSAASRSVCLLLAALAVLPASAAPARSRAARSRRLALARLALWVARRGTDREVDKYDVRIIGLKSVGDVPMRTVTLAPSQSPDGRGRALSLAYNSDGKTLQPVAFVLWRVDISSAVPYGPYNEGRTFLSKLDGELVSVVREKQQPSASGFRQISVPVPVEVDEPDSVAGFREELSIWLAKSAN